MLLVLSLCLTVSISKAKQFSREELLNHEASQTNNDSLTFVTTHYPNDKNIIETVQDTYKYFTTDCASVQK